MNAISKSVAAACWLPGRPSRLWWDRHASCPRRSSRETSSPEGPNGTYIQIGRDISRIAGQCGLTLNVRESAGSLENFLGVRQRRHTQFGIVQSDVLEYLSTYSADDPAIARAIAGVRIAFPLYNEEVHVLARRDIAGLSDLTDRKVAIGVEDSGTFLTASLVLDLAGVEPSERVTINATDSLAALEAGEIDAFFYVAGAPTSLFQSGEIDAARFHLLPIDDPTLQAVYLQAEIPAGTYPFQPDPVSVVAVKAVLMTYEYNRGKNSYHRLSCDSVADISHLILTRSWRLAAGRPPEMAERRSQRHSAPVGVVGNCVNRGLAEGYSVPCGIAGRCRSIARRARRTRPIVRESVL